MMSSQQNNTAEVEFHFIKKHFDGEVSQYLQQLEFALKGIQISIIDKKNTSIWLQGKYCSMTNQKISYPTQMYQNKSILEDALNSCILQNSLYQGDIRNIHKVAVVSSIAINNNTNYNNNVSSYLNNLNGQQMQNYNNDYQNNYFLDQRSKVTQPMNQCFESGDEDERQELKQQIEDLKAEKQQLRDENTSFKIYSDVYENKIKSLEQMREQSGKTEALLTDKVQDLEKKNKKLKKKLETSEEKNSNAEQLEKQNEEKKQKIIELNKNIQLLEQKNQELLLSIESYAQKQKEAEDNNKTVLKELNSIKINKAQLEEKNKLLQQQLDSIQEKQQQQQQQQKYQEQQQQQLQKELEINNQNIINSEIKINDQKQDQQQQQYQQQQENKEQLKDNQILQGNELSVNDEINSKCDYDDAVEGDVDDDKSTQAKTELISKPVKINNLDTPTQEGQLILI